MKSDKQMLDMLRNEFEKSSESAKIPLKLQKESMVAMLKNEETKETDFSVKTGTKIVTIRKLATVAAMFAVVIIGILAMRADGVKVIKRDTFYKSYEGAQIVKSAQSYEEFEVAVKEILESKNEPVSAPQTPAVQPAPDNKETTKLYEGYRNIAEKEPETIVGKVYTASAFFVGADSFKTADDVHADIVRINGGYIYIVTTGKNLQTGNMTEQIKTVRASSDGKMEVVSTLTLSDNVVAGAFEECIEIYIKNNTLIAILGKNDFETESVTKAVYYDVSDPEKPVKIREHSQDGKYLFSSLNGNSLCLVTDKQILVSDSTLVPSFTVDGKTENLNAEEIFISVNDPEASFIFITVTDISAPDKSVGRLAILGSGKQLYCSETTITAAREFVSVDPDENGSYPSLTEIYRFNVDGSSISLAGSYIIEGSLVGGVSVSGEKEFMTAVSTVADSTNIYVFDNNMGFVSGLRQIMPQKKISNVRYIGNKAYISSGAETVTVDLSKPESPQVAGTISTKLFAGNLYEISPSKLLGMNADENGKVTFRLFDVSDSEKPAAIAEYTLPEEYLPVLSSDSRSVMIISEKEIFGIPVVINDGETDSDVSAYLLFDISQGDIVNLGLCRHDEHYVGDAAVRAICIDGTVYTVSGERISAFSLETLEKTADCGIR